jgi:murein L,D-transpeptidase YcbB/YkuD
MVQRMNTPIKKYIRTIKVNMEAVDGSTLRSCTLEYIISNIPAFKLTYSKNGNKELESNLLVGGNGLKQWLCMDPLVLLFLVRIEQFQKHH